MTAERNKKVVVIGGGVAGLTAAHELQERGFEVVVYERDEVLGGKARSFLIPKDAKNLAIRGLPAEHGFRFFPGFYKHLTHTLARIPCAEPGAERKCVRDHLIEPKWAAYARRGTRFLRLYTDRPETVSEYLSAITGMLANPALGVPPFEAAFAAFKLVKAMTMCPERREEELDGQTWWDYMQADDMSPQYRSVVVNGLTQNFVAMDAKNSSTKSVINILARLLDDVIRTGLPMDRILDGPTSEVWIDPWVRYLTTPRPGQSPVVFRKGRAVVSLIFDESSSRIAGIKLRRRARRGEDNDATPELKGVEEADADYFVAAVPIEAMQRILHRSPDEIKVHAPSLANLDSHVLETNWMSGIMYYLKEDVPMEDVGHLIFLDSKWALTGISQNQFWRKKVAEYGGKANGILSVIVSDWGATSPHIGKAAWQCDDEEEIAQETLGQIREHLAGTEMCKQLYWENVVGFYVDPAIRYRRATIENEEGRPERLSLVGLMPAREFAARKARLRGQPRLVRSKSSAALGRGDREVGEFGSERPAITDDDFVKDETPNEFVERNIEPLFINTDGSWQLRPIARTEIENLFLASDYVRTNTDLATMEGANEAARRAVNGILDASASNHKRCAIFEFDEPAVFAPLRAVDKWMYDRGLGRPRVVDRALSLFAYVRGGLVSRVAAEFSRYSRFAERTPAPSPRS